MFGQDKQFVVAEMRISYNYLISGDKIKTILFGRPEQKCNKTGKAASGKVSAKI